MCEKPLRPRPSSNRNRHGLGRGLRMRTIWVAALGRPMRPITSSQREDRCR